MFLVVGALGLLAVVTMCHQSYTLTIGVEILCWQVIHF
jgi:hypothetical protein